MRKLLAIGAVLLGCASRAGAHPLPGSTVALDFEPRRIHAELRLTLSDLQLAFRQPLTAHPGEVVARYGPALSEYLRAHIQPVSPDGAPWRVRVDGLAEEAASAQEPASLRVQVELEPLPGEPAQKLTLNFDVITHEVVTHTILVSARRDWENRVYADKPELLGVIRWTHKSIAIDRSRGSAWNGFVGVVGLGVQHIAEGTDHLLFLLALLLPAPLLARGRRWGEAAGLRAAAVRLLRIVTAFTVGHSATLVLGALGWVRLPAAPVEVLIAVSILVSAVHAARPLFPGREAYVAGGFGLVHGLAFASAIAGLGLDPWRMALSILGFNLGIELMQLAVVAAAAPALLLLARDPLYAPVRWAGAGLAGISALGWIAERAFDLANPLARGAEAVAAHPAIVLGLLTGLALAVRGVRALTSVDGAALASPPHQGPGTPSRP